MKPTREDWEQMVSTLEKTEASFVVQFERLQADLKFCKDRLSKYPKPEKKLAINNGGVG